MRSKSLFISAAVAGLSLVGAAPATAGETCKTVLPDGTTIAGTPYVSSSHSLLGNAVGDHRVLVGPYAAVNPSFPDPLVSITAKSRDGFTYVIAKSPTGAVGSGVSTGWTRDDWLQQSQQFVKCMEKRRS